MKPSILSTNLNYLNQQIYNFLLLFIYHYLPFSVTWLGGGGGVMSGWGDGMGGDFTFFCPLYV